MKYKCIIFDCDGVLVDSENITAQVLVQMSSDLGLPSDLEFATQNFLGKSLNDIMSHLKLEIGHIPDNFEKEYRKRTYAAFEKELKPIEGVKNLLKKINVPYCVASSGPKEKIQRNLKITGLLDNFYENIYSCYELKLWKPDPGIYLYASEQMGFEPWECAVIEDSPTGIQASVSGGFDTFVYSPNNSKEQLPNLNYFAHMDDLYDLLKSH